MPSNFTTDDETRVAGIQSTISALQGLISDITSQNSSVGIKSYIRETDLNCVISGCEIVKITGTMKVGIQAGADPLSVAYVQGTRFAPENKITASNYGVIVPPTTSTYQRHIVCLNGNGGIQLVTSAPAADYDYDSAFTKDLLPLYLLHVPAYTTLNIDSGSVTLTDIRQYYSRGIRLPSYQYPAGKTFTLTQTHGAYGAGLYLKTASGWETIITSITGSILGVVNGGTGATSFMTNAVLFGNGTGAIQAHSSFLFSPVTTTVSIGTGGTYTGSILMGSSGGSPRIQFPSGAASIGLPSQVGYYPTADSSVLPGDLLVSSPGRLFLFAEDYKILVKTPSGGAQSAISIGPASTDGVLVNMSRLGLSTPLSVGSGGTGLTTIPAGRILYGNDTSAISTSAHLTYDGTNLGIGISSPESKLHVNHGGGSFYVNSGDEFATASAESNHIRFSTFGWKNATVISARTDTTNATRSTTGLIISSTYGASTYASAAININCNTGSGSIDFFTGTSSSAPTEKMKLTTAGNLGIGTTNPFARLQVVNPSGTAVPTLGTGSGHFAISNGTYGTAFGVTTNGGGWIQQHRFDSTATAYSLLLQPVGGNVTINNAPDLSKLSVNGLVTQWGHQQGFAAVGYGSDFTNYESLTFAHAGANGAQFISSGVGTGTIRDFKWLTWDGSTAPVLMTLTPAGYLGLNTTNPIARIDVVSDVNNTVQGSMRVRNVSTGINGMSLYYTGDSTSVYTAVFGSTGTGSTAYTGGQTGIVGTIKNIPLTVIRNNVFHSIFDTSGNIGLGTASPSSYMSGMKGLAISTPNAGLAFNDTLTGKTYLLYNNLSNLKLFDPSIPGDIVNINSGGKVLLGVGVGGGTAAARLHIKDTSEQLRLGYDASNYVAFQVASNGGSAFSSVGSNPYFLFWGDSTSSTARVVVKNANANAYGAFVTFETQSAARGYIGALKHGSASDVLFVGETADGFGIRAQSVLEFGIGGAGIGRWNTTGLGIGSLFNPSAALHIIKTTEQLRLGYDANNYLAIQVGSGWGVTLTKSGDNPSWSFQGDSAYAAVRHVINNNNANAYGALTLYRTQGFTRGLIGALKHGSSGDVLFNGETADGFGISAQSVLEMGIYTTGLMRLTTGGLAVGGLFNPSAALHVIKTTEQLRLGYNASNYQSVTVGATGSLQFTHTGTTPPHWYFTGSSTAGTSPQIVLNNSNANAFGALINFQTEGTTRGYIGALKHGSSSDALFSGETADGIGIQAMSVLEMGISYLIKFRMDSSSTRFMNANFRIDQAPVGTAGAATGTFMTINLNGTDYKIALLANA